MNIILKNCNNIDSANIIIFENKLNIKYALNGTGKTAIALAIAANGSPEKLQKLLPFKHRATKSLLTPSIEGLPDGCTYAIFNEEYVKQFLFQQDELIKNSFDIFIKTPEYEEHMSAIENLIKRVKETFINNEQIREIFNILKEFTEKYGKTQKGDYSKSGVFGKGLANGNKLKNIPENLQIYKDYLEHSKNVEWIDWQTKGAGYLDISACCPYCTSANIQRDTVLKVKEEYGGKYLEHLKTMLDLIDKISAYLVEPSQDIIESIKNNVSDITEEQKNVLKEIIVQIKILIQRLEDIQNLNFNSLKTVDDITAILKGQKIDMDCFSHINSSKIKEYIDPINTEIDSLLDDAGKLKGEISQQKKVIETLVSQNEGKINSFFQCAGYPYEVHLKATDKGEYQLKLFHQKFTEESISNGENILSYGERNAFALVLFMHSVLKQNPDIIILDDPISSFDENKKFAMMNQLFTGSNTLNNKTVILLTHDFNTVIDAVKNLSSIFQSKTFFLENKNGNLTEKNITNNDIMSWKTITKRNICRNSNNILKLVYLRRLFEFDDRESKYGYNILSSLLHKKPAPTIKEDNEEITMDNEQSNKGTEEIKCYITDFSYEEILKNLKDTKSMKKLYEESKVGYEKLHLYRIIKGELSTDERVFNKFINQTYHIENDFLFQLDPAKYEIIPDYIIKKCDEEILNDEN